MEYRIIYAEGFDEKYSRQHLEHEVKELIAIGWKPFGGISVSRSDTNAYKKIVFAQAMIKEESDK